MPTTGTMWSPDPVLKKHRNIYNTDGDDEALKHVGASLNERSHVHVKPAGAKLSTQERRAVTDIVHSAEMISLIGLG